MPDINGTNNSETLTGGYYRDTIYGMLGSDTINGGYGDDVLYGDQSEDDWGESPATGGVDIIRGGFGNDEIWGDAGDDQLFGDSGYDEIHGGMGKDQMFGGSGNDTLDVGTWFEMLGDKVNGGEGIDELVADFSARTAITINALDPNANALFMGTLAVTGVERYNIIGTNYNDSLTGWNHDDTFEGGAGNDTLRGMGGKDDLNGGAGADVINGGAGHDTIYGDDYDAGFADQIWGDTGEDYIDAGGGADKVYGGADNDDIVGGDGADALYGDAGDDEVTGGAGADGMAGGEGNDELWSNQVGYYLPHNLDTNLTEKDYVDGGNGNDKVGVGVGDTAKGGAGIDTVVLSFNTSTVGVTYALTTAVRTLANGTIVQDFEQLEFAGGSGVDTITGGALTDKLYGGLGNDALAGGAGDDTLDGEAGVDTLNGGLGNDMLNDDATASGDTLNGGDGNDIITGHGGADKLNGDAGDDMIFVYGDAQLGDVVNGGLGTDTVDFGDNFSNEDISVSLNLANQALNDGLAKRDTFTAVEIFKGTNNDDLMIGDATNNIFFGGGQDDRLEGGAGNDRLIGEDGSDILVGGAGIDTFVLEAGSNDGTEWPADIITDFVRGTDKLEISRWEFAETMSFSSGAGVSSGTTSAHLHFDTTTSRLWFDADGAATNESPILVATLNSVTALALTDIVFVG